MKCTFLLDERNRSFIRHHAATDSDAVWSEEAKKIWCMKWLLRSIGHHHPDFGEIQKVKRQNISTAQRECTCQVNGWLTFLETGKSKNRILCCWL
jgi:hypothetical protein